VCEWGEGGGGARWHGSKCSPFRTIIYLLYRFIYFIYLYHSVWVNLDLSKQTFLSEFAWFLCRKKKAVDSIFSAKGYVFDPYWIVKKAKSLILAFVAALRSVLLRPITSQSQSQSALGFEKALRMFSGVFFFFFFLNISMLNYWVFSFSLNFDFDWNQRKYLSR
jgi:hypothetical protein